MTDPGATIDAALDGRDPQLEDFHAFLPTHQYLFTATRDLWPAASVNSRIAPIKDGKKDIRPSVWLDNHKPLHQLIWAPREPELIVDRLAYEGGWSSQLGKCAFNLYRPPALRPIPGDVQPWLDHLRTIYPDDDEHILRWLAQRLQQPAVKINHALALGGKQGIGKDTLLEPIKRAVGPWNFGEISPSHMLERFNGFARSVILRINEARDLGEMNRYAFYEHTKMYTAAPPDVLRINEKYRPECTALNCTGVIITTNHQSDGIYLPNDDRRHYVAWSPCEAEQFTPHYWNDLWAWFDAGGAAHVSHYLHKFDLSGFDPKAPPPKTAAFWVMVSANQSPEAGDMTDALEVLGFPHAVTLDRVIAVARSEFQEYLRDRGNRRVIPFRFEEAGYVPVRNPDAKDGLWKIGGRRIVVYAHQTLPLRDCMSSEHFGQLALAI